MSIHAQGRMLRYNRSDDLRVVIDRCHGQIDAVDDRYHRCDQEDGKNDHDRHRDDPWQVSPAIGKRGERVRRTHSLSRENYTQSITWKYGGREHGATRGKLYRGTSAL